MESIHGVSCNFPDEPASPYTTYLRPKKKKNHTTPFSTDASIYIPSAFLHPAGVNFQYKLIKPNENLQGYLAVDLTTPKLNQIHHLLWLAGLPRPARPLHRQKLINRSVALTESPDEHLVWNESQIFIKPIPEYLLDHEFWTKELCPHPDLHNSACGLLLSYAWLISCKLDFQIAKDERILPAEVTWDAWTLLIREFLEWIDNTERGPLPITYINQRYQFGELRLTRLNSLYRFTPSIFSIRNLVFGFMPSSTCNAGWIGNQWATGKFQLPKTMYRVHVGLYYIYVYLYRDNCSFMDIVVLLPSLFNNSVPQAGPEGAEELGE
ncbi:hypothetical protein AJ80_08951 [Polytolypa hystricis UAMH7299]|uniref:Uncharacterized protein n=1 Tax=Polytolypa hystricis (strain UAMH7299) TaxID=1447883 RepID=A0A2B7WZ42_POLH7|nr:hypothetical protein AJ80_08951 [Polytolypa hystricis UAMH7299]